MEIRRIQVADVPGFLMLWERVDSEGGFFANGPPPADRVRMSVEKVVRDGVPNFVAVKNESVIGVVEVLPGAMCGRSFAGDNKVGYLGLQVAAEHRRKGIGRKLLRTVIADSTRYGFEAIGLAVFRSNVGAIRLYHEAGFVVRHSTDELSSSEQLSAREQYMTLSLVNGK